MSKDLDKSIIAKLAVLGLTEKESIVYIDLLKRKGPTGTSKVVFSTGLHGQYIYTALSSLEKKGLVKHSVINGRKKFEANSPERIAHLIDAKKVVADEVTDELFKLSKKSFDQNFEIYQGDASFSSHQLEMAENTPNDSYWYVISSQERKFVDIIGDSINIFMEIAKERNIRTRVIGVGADVEWFLRANKDFPGYKYKMLPGLKEGASSLVIRDGNVSFESFDPIPLCYTVHNKVVAENYKNIFEVLWNMLEGEKI
ncbi:MAG: transcriptional regulator TrmB [Candidatus Nomurabacteria bacterium]|nr:transcriptional regulator TrmB [Candidatus Nomurabacteria bacterium]